MHGDDERDLLELRARQLVVGGERDILLGLRSVPRRHVSECKLHDYDQHRVHGLHGQQVLG